MRRLLITLLLFAAVTLGQSLNGWRDGKEYSFKISSCTLASFSRQAKQFSGIVIKGQFHVQSSDPETLRARISQAQYAPIHTQLDVDWDSEIPCDHMHMKNLSLSDEPFEIKITRGVIKALIVDKYLSTWEKNILKSIVGQLQLDIEDKQDKKSKNIQVPGLKQPYAWYKTMEDSVGGKCEVLYNISTLPAYMQQTTPELYSIPELDEREDFIEIAKTKNYGNCDKRFSHHYEFSGHTDWMPDNNDIGKYLSRSSRSRIVISGDVWKYTIRSSISLNKVLLNPSYKNQDYPGMIYSKMETSLLKVDEIRIRMQSPSDPEFIENLAYDYSDSFKKEESPRQSHYTKSHKGENKESWQDGDDFYEIVSGLHSKEQYRDIHFEKTSTSLPDPNQFTPFSIGNYKYLTTKNKINSVRYAESIAREIGNETIQFDSMFEDNTLVKFTILSKLVCLMNANEINEVHQMLYEPSQSGLLSQGQKARRNTWTVFRDAVAQAGNEPALYNIMKWIKEKKIMGNDAANVIDSMAKTTRTPTPKYIDTFLEILKFKEVNDQPVVYDHTHQSYADLLYHTVVNKASSDARYPVHVFGKFYGQNIHNLHIKYFPYMTAELQDGFAKKDSIKIQALISAIGKTGHPRMVSVFEPYIEGKKNATPYERFLMVISMHRLANDYADIARSVLYNIYSNVDDYYEIRTAAVYLLMQTHPPAKILQRMANFTRYDTNKQVSSAVKSSIEWLASYQIGNNEDIRDAAKMAIPLLTPQIYGSQYSRGVFMKATDSERKGMGLEAYYIGSDDSVIPKGVFVTIYFHRNEIKMPKIQMAAAVSQVQDLWDSLHKQLGIKERDKGSAERKRYSPENISKIFGINGDKPELLEGFMSFTNIVSTGFASVSDSEKSGYSEDQVNNLLIDFPQRLRRLKKDLSRGIGFDDTSMTNDEMTMSFPTETGYPLIFALKTSKISKVTGQCSGQIESYCDDQTPIPKSANISAKVHIIYGMNVQKHLSFMTPFDDQEYISGIDQNMQLYLPLEIEVEYNKIKQEARLKFQPNTEKPQFKILQVKVEPFTSKHDIVSLKPVSNDINTRIIHKNVTLPLQVELNYNKQSLQFHWATLGNQLVLEKNEQLKNEMALQAARKMAGAVASMHFGVGEDTEYQAYTVRLSLGSDMGMEMKASYDVLIKDFIKSNEEKVNQEHEMPLIKSPSLNKNMTEFERKHKLSTEAARNINSATTYAIDVSLNIEGDFQSSATLTAASTRSNVDEKARTLLYASAEIPKSGYYFFSTGIESKSPNFRTMNYEETLKADSDHEVVAELKYGKKDDEPETLKFNGKSAQSEKFKEQIRNSRQAQECLKKTSHTSNTLIPACMKANDHAFLMNVGHYDITFENKSLLHAWAMNYLGSRPRFVPHSRPRGHDAKEKNKITLNYEIFPDKRDYTVNIITSNGRITESTPIPPSLLYHWDEYTEINEERESLETAVAPYLTCALDKTQIRTFDNYRYDTRLGQCWHVAMTTFPKNDYFRPGHHKEIPEDEHVTIMIRDNEDGHKELKITAGDKEVELSSQGPNRTIEATVDGEKIDLSNKYGWQENKTREIGLQIFELPDKSVKLISERYEVKVTYDGFRAMIKVGDKYRASVRGLCGDNNGEPANDLKTPKGCLLEKPIEFTATYALINDEQCLGPARQIAEAAKQSKCIDDVAHPGNVITDNDAGRKHYDNSSISGEETEYNTKDSNWIKHDSIEDARCLKDRTMVRKHSSEICFSMQPVSTCVSGCHATGEESKSIAFHCVLRSATSESVAESIKRGANLDFTNEKIAKKENHMIPIGCTY